MKAFVITVVAPSSWTESDMVSSVHIGMQEMAKCRKLPLPVMDYHAMCKDSFELKRQDDTQKEGS